MSIRIDLTGQKFHRLKVVRLDEERSTRKSYWWCECDCGNFVSARSDQLKDGNTKSCGCLKRETDRINASKNHTHKMSGTRLYHIWQNMKARCYNHDNKYFSIYGGKGVTVCEEWKNDFSAFHKWALNNGYNKTLTIDRINVDGDYEPSNCRWVDAKKQANNRTSNVLIEHQGETLNLTQWADKLGIKRSTIFTRYHRGYRGEKLFAPVKNYK